MNRFISDNFKLVVETKYETCSRCGKVPDTIKIESKVPMIKGSSEKLLDLDNTVATWFWKSYSQETPNSQTCYCTLTGTNVFGSWNIKKIPPQLFIGNKKPCLLQDVHKKITFRNQTFGVKSIIHQDSLKETVVSVFRNNEWWKEGNSGRMVKYLPSEISGTGGELKKNVILVQLVNENQVTFEGLNREDDTHSQETQHKGGVLIERKSDKTPGLSSLSTSHCSIFPSLLSSPLQKESSVGHQGELAPCLEGNPETPTELLETVDDISPEVEEISQPSKKKKKHNDQNEENACYFCKTNEQLPKHLETNQKCFQLYLKRHNISESNQMKAIWIVCCLENFCVGCGLETGRKLLSHIKKEPCLQKNKNLSRLSSPEQMIQFIGKMKKKGKATQVKATDTLVLVIESMAGTMELQCSICRTLLDRAKAHSKKVYDNIGPRLSAKQLYHAHTQDESTRDVEDNFNMCKPCNEKMGLNGPAIFEEKIRLAKAADELKPVLKLIEIGENTAFVPSVFSQEGDYSRKQPDMSTTIFVPWRSTDVGEDKIKACIKDARKKSKSLKELKKYVSKFHNTEPNMVSNILYRSMFDKIGNDEEGIRLAMNKVRTGNVSSDISPAKRVSIKSKGKVNYANIGLMRRVSSSEEYLEKMSSENFARCLTHGRVKLSVNIQVLAKDLLDNLEHHPALAAALLLFHYKIPTGRLQSKDGKTEFKVRCMNSTTNRFCHPWKCSNNPHKHPLLKLKENLKHQQIESELHHTSIVARYTRKLVSNLVKKLFEGTYKYDLYLRFGKGWKVSLVGHVWPKSLVPLNTVLTQEEINEAHLKIVVKHLEKNITVSTDVNILKSEFGFESERAMNLAGVARCCQKSLSSQFLPSAITFAVLPIVELHEDTTAWKNAFLEIANTMVITDSHKSAYKQYSPYIQTVLVLMAECKQRGLYPFVVNNSDLKLVNLVANIINHLKPFISAEAIHDVGPILLQYHYFLALAYSHPYKSVLIHKRLLSEMEIAPYSPTILEAVNQPVVFSLETDPNTTDNPFMPVNLQERRQEFQEDSGHTELSTWSQLGYLAFVMTQGDDFKISWTSEEVIVINVSKADTKFRRAKAADEEREDIFYSEEENKYVKTSNVRKYYIERPSILESMVIAEFGSIYRVYPKSEKEYKTAKEKCIESNNSWLQSDRTYYYDKKIAPKYILLKSNVLMKTRDHHNVIQIYPSVLTDFAKQLLYSAYTKESHLSGSLDENTKRQLDEKRLSIFPCSLDLKGHVITFSQKPVFYEPEEEELGCGSFFTSLLSKSFP